MRYVHPSGHVTDIYAKSGDSGLYSSWLVLIPEFDAGFSVMMAGSVETRFTVAATLADLVTNTIVPALQAQSVAVA